MTSRTPETWTHGAVMLDDEHTRFALWAPDAFLSVSNSTLEIQYRYCPKPTAGS